MAKEKQKVRYLEANVFEEAKRRINQVIDSFDKIFVCFSGGKDSLVTLLLTEMIFKERGIVEPVNVIFRDEELIPDEVVAFVQKYAAMKGRFNFFYYAVPLKSQKFILGKTFEYVQWDESREWVRPKPDFAITAPKGMVFDQYSMDAFCAQGHKGRLAFLNGIRADESLVRFASVIRKKNESHIAASSTPNVSLVKPIYDWSEKDVFKFFYDFNIDYCPVYDLQMWNQQALRVATPIHAENAKILNKLKTSAPTLYEQVMDIFPEMRVQELYWKEYDRYGAIGQYKKGWGGVFDYIRENIEDPAMRKLAFKRVLEAKKIRENNLTKGKYRETLGGYPVLHVFKAIINGSFKRAIQPDFAPTQKELDYEADIASGAV